MANSPSKLEPFRAFIASERRRRTPYRRIAELLAEKGVEIDYSTIHAFVKVRSKPPRKVITMLEPEDEEVTQQPRIPKAAAGKTRPNVGTERSGQLDAIRRLKNAKPAKRQPGKGLPSFREDAPLERLSEEQAARLRKKL